MVVKKVKKVDVSSAGVNDEALTLGKPALSSFHDGNLTLINLFVIVFYFLAQTALVSSNPAPREFLMAVQFSPS